METIYNDSFKNLVQTNDQGLYIGKGNPNSKVLFVGKEAAIDKDEHLDQFIREISNNANDWENNIKNNIEVNNVGNWFELNTTFNPLFPYKGQKNTIYTNTKKNGEKGLGGTSSTWFYYQKLIDNLYFENKQSNYLNFPEYSFLTELNEATANYSSEVDNTDRLASISNRKPFLSNEFYKSFPIVIVAAGHYIKDHNVNLEKMFDVTYDLEKGVISAQGKKFINVHYDNIENPMRIVLHTNQLSNVSNDLLEKICELVKPFLKI